MTQVTQVNSGESGGKISFWVWFPLEFNVFLWFFKENAAPPDSPEFTGIGFHLIVVDFIEASGSGSKPSKPSQANP